MEPIMKKFRNIIAFLGLLTAVALAPFAFATSPIALGGSIFPLTLIQTSPINLTDGFNEMLMLINQQVVGISPIYSNAATIPVGGVDTSGVTFSNNMQANPLAQLNFTDVSATLTSTVGATPLIASAVGRSIHPTGPATIMASGTAGTATAVALICSGGAI